MTHFFAETSPKLHIFPLRDTGHACGCTFFPLRVFNCTVFPLAWRIDRYAHPARGKERRLRLPYEKNQHVALGLNRGCCEQGTGLVFNTQKKLDWKPLSPVQLSVFTSALALVLLFLDLFATDDLRCNSTNRECSHQQCPLVNNNHGQENVFGKEKNDN